LLSDVQNQGNAKIICVVNINNQRLRINNRRCNNISQL
jgi:hypothetical protein